MEKMFLTRNEQRILDKIKEFEDIFSQEDIVRLNGKKQYKAILGLQKKGYILRLKRDRYIINERFLERPYYFAAKLEKGALAFITALKIHGLVEYEPRSVFVLTDSKSYVIKTLNYEIHYINLKRKFGLTQVDSTPVTDIEKTIIDSFFKPEYSGGYSTVIRAAYEARINWRRLLRYLKKYNKSSLYQKTGYVLSLLSKQGKEVPEYVLNAMRRHVKNKLRLIPNPKLRYSYDREWKIMDNLGKDKLRGAINGA